MLQRFSRQCQCARISAALPATYETVHNSSQNDTQGRVIARQAQIHSFFNHLLEMLAFRDAYPTSVSRHLAPCSTPTHRFFQQRNALQVESFSTISPHLEPQISNRGQGFASCTLKDTIKQQLECGHTATPSRSMDCSAFRIYRANPANMCCLKGIPLSLGPGKIHLQKGSQKWIQALPDQCPLETINSSAHFFGLECVTLRYYQCQVEHLVS